MIGAQTTLIRSYAVGRGRIICKGGAEGFRHWDHAGTITRVTCPGIAFKVSDGI